MTVLFIPDYSNENPYQSNLAGALDEEVSYGRRDSRLPIVSAVLRDDVSVVHVHWLNLFFKGDTWRETAAGLAVLWLRIAAIRFAGVPVVWTVHNVRMHEPEHPWLERQFKRWFISSGTCHRLIVHCEAAAETFLTEFDLPERTRDRIDVIPHGHYLDNYENDVTTDEARDTLGVDHSSTVFLFFGLIRRYKGILDLVDAFESARVPESTLVLAGSPTTEALHADLRARTTDLEGVRGIYEYIPDDEIQLYMNAADVVVLPFRKITTSGSAVLAMSFGTALVLPELGCLPEMADEEGTIFYDPTDPAGLTGALEESTSRDLDRMGRVNEEHVAGFDWEGIARETESTYRQAM